MASNYKRYRRKRNNKNNPYNDNMSISGLDNHRLYITKLPDNFSRKDLEREFSQFGTLLQCHKSTDKAKNYALVKYSTPGEARIAMAKMHKAEPYRLNIEIALKDTKDNQKADVNNNRDTELNVSVKSSNMFDDLSDEDIIEEEIPPDENFEEDDIDDDLVVEVLDPDLNMEMEKLRLMEAQILYKQRYRAFLMAEKRNAIAAAAAKNENKETTSNNSCFQPENILNTKFDLQLPLDAATALMPPLKVCLNSNKPCVLCASPSKYMCNRCKVTPYCTETCQKQDWTTRHKSICHNLANNRLITNDIVIRPRPRREDNKTDD